FVFKLALQIDKLFRYRLATTTDAIVTFTDDERIFGQRTIRISNGIDFSKIPLREATQSGDGTLHVIGVAEVHYWHGFDRFVKGMGEYYRNGGKRNIVFHIVGEVGREILEGNENSEGLLPIIGEYGIADRVVMHGPLYGSELDRVFSQCSFAVASLARHRSGITSIKTLKNREYAARGFAFVYSETDTDFDRMPYVCKVSPDETPVDIERIIKFIDGLTMTPAEIRSSISGLSWANQMKKVLCQI
ncbi:MAG: glycosyltransferase family 1 protein, partial [Bacteroidaceae bacterium]|nr:glycosyltransferase family 1 protein [Bacteroidaceae bacterium]